MIEFRMPSLGADMEAGTLVEWLVRPGDEVKRGDVVALVDTQKGLFDIEVFDEGKVENLVLKVGDKVPVGTIMAILNGEKRSDVKKETPPVKEVTKMEIAPHEKNPAPKEHGIKASPLAKKIAAEKGIDLSAIHGTGEEGVITKADVENAIVEKAGEQKSSMPKESSSASATSIRMAVAAAMSRSNSEIPHYYLETKIDLSKSLAWLAEANKQRSAKQRLLPVVLLIKAIAKALTEVPQLNAHWENGLQLKEAINIGFVISLRTGGILIPAISNADRKSIDEIMESINEIIPRARALKLRSSDVIDTSITVTSLLEGGATSVYGVIYPPQVALIGIGAISEQPWAESGMLDVRPVVAVSLAADHRATDGMIGSRFLKVINNQLQNPSAL